MANQSCVIFISDNTEKTGYRKPLMLQNIMGAALLSWLVSSLETGGCGRFFLICPEKFRTEALACFPAGVQVTAAGGEGTSDRLHVFLSTADVEEKEVVIITQPVLLLPRSATPDFRNAPVPTRAFAVSRRALMDALDERFSFQDFFVEHGRPMTDRDGWYTISSPEELADWQTIYNRETLCRLAASGVEVWDYTGCWVDPDVLVGSGTVLLPGTILKKGTVIGRGCRIGPNAYLENAKVDDGAAVNASQVHDAIVGAESRVGPYACVRPGTVVGKNCRIGDFAEVSDAGIGDGTVLCGHCFVEGCDVGRNVRLEAGVVTRKPAGTEGRILIGDGCTVTVGTVLTAPVTLGTGASTLPGSVITENVPEHAVGGEHSQVPSKKAQRK